MMMTTTIPMNSTRSDSSSGSSPEPDALAVMPGGQPDFKHSYSGSSPELKSPPAPVARARADRAVMRRARLQARSSQK